MKTTIDLPDELMIGAKKRAAELRCSLRTLVERGLRHELPVGRPKRTRRKRVIRWVTVRGGLPPGLDLRDRRGPARLARPQSVIAVDTNLSV